eukprot:11186234-Lingulodinium_polyedra.AAC.1
MPSLLVNEGGPIRVDQQAPAAELVLNAETHVVPFEILEAVVELLRDVARQVAAVLDQIGEREA